LEHDQIHVVRSGEWLHKIARTYYVDVNIIIQINGLVSTKVTPGQALVIPDASYSHHAGATCPSLATAPSCAATPSYEATGCRAHYVVKRGDNLFRISLKYHVSLSAMAAKNGIRAPHHVYVGQRLCVP
jgi:LysM repeat protein